MSEKRFAGKVALVTGATSGIGQACAIAFATAGAKVACVGRNEEALGAVTKRIRSFDAEALPDRVAWAREVEALIRSE